METEKWFWKEKWKRGFGLSEMERLKLESLSLVEPRETVGTSLRSVRVSETGSARNDRNRYDAE